MKQGSRARHKQRYRRFSSGSVAAVSSGGDLAAALAMAADSSDERAPDRPAATLVREDRQDPPVPEKDHAPRAHLEDDFFARGDEIASFPPSSIDARHLEAEEVVHRPISPLVLARRARMRRIVGAVVGTAAVLTSLVVTRAWLSHKSPSPASDSALSVPNRIVPSIAIAPPQEPSPAAAAPAAPQSAPPDEPAPVAAAANHRLPIVDLETPAPPDDATDRAWEKAAKSLSAQDFNGADRVFAELGRSADVATRETARLARAVWWISNGKEAEVRPVLADLAAHATTPYVQTRARELSRPN
jgi:hypothetical protein